MGKKHVCEWMRRGDEDETNGGRDDHFGKFAQDRLSYKRSYSRWSGIDRLQIKTVHTILCLLTLYLHDAQTKRENQPPPPSDHIKMLVKMYSELKPRIYVNSFISVSLQASSTCLFAQMNHTFHVICIHIYIHITYV